MGRKVVRGLAAAALLAAVAAGTVFGWRWWLDRPVNPLTADGAPELAVMDFAQPVALDPPASGWRHRTFLTRPAMTISQAEKDGRPALKCETDGSGSIFGRFTDIDLGAYPALAWTWQVEKPVDSLLDERTVEGDDHPARLYLRFETGDGSDHTIEIIWANKLFKPGDYKYIGTFPHYVANGGNANVGRWFEERVDLLKIYRETSKRGDTPRVKFIGIFCDTDDTKTSSVAYFGKVWMVKGAGG